MAIRDVEFSNGGIKLEIVLPKNQHTQRKLFIHLLVCYFLLLENGPKNLNNSKFTKEQEIEPYLDREQNQFNKN